MTTDPNNPNPIPASPPQYANHARRNAWILVVLLVVVTIMLLAPRLVKPRPQMVTADPRGQFAPDFTLKDINGKTVRLSDYRGKAVVVNFWATWCPPCKIEMPWFVNLENKYQSQGVQILGVALDEAGKDEIAKFAHDMNLNYPVLIGDDNTADAYGNVQMLPTTFYIDAEGKIVSRVIGLTDEREIEDSMIQALQSNAHAAKSTRTGGS